MNVTASPDANSLLANWSGACSGNSNPCIITMDGDKSVTANFVLGKKLTATLAGTGTGSVASADGALSCASAASPCSALFLPGASVVLTGNPDASSLFGSWGGACSGSTNTCTVTMDADKPVTANFILGMTLSVTLAGTGTGSVTSNSGGINCAAGPCSAVYLPGTTVALTAVPSSTSVFTSWSDACTGTNPSVCNVTLNSGQSVTATFTLLDFSVTTTSPTLTVQHGAVASAVLTLASQGGLTSVLALTCSVTGPAPLPPCNLNPASVTLGPNPVTSTLTVNTSSLSAALAATPTSKLVHGFYAVVLPLWLIVGMVATRNQEQRRRMWLTCTLILLAAILPMASGCGTSQTRFVPKTFNVTVQAKDSTGTFNHTTTITLTVQ